MRNGDDLYWVSGVGNGEKIEYSIKVNHMRSAKKSDMRVKEVLCLQIFWLKQLDTWYWLSLRNGDQGASFV